MVSVLNLNKGGLHMKTKKRFLCHVLAGFTFLIALFMLTPQPAKAAISSSTLTNDLEQLVLTGNNLVATLEKISLTPLTMSSQLASLETSVNNYLESVGSLYKTVAASTDNTTLSLTNEILVPLQTLAAISGSLAQGLMGLSTAMITLAPLTSLTTLNASLDSMLRLSDDIGVMADRILEMADKILIMADNIGIMADRILATQVIQSDNLKLIVDASLETQKNTLLLFSMFFQ